MKKELTKLEVDCESIRKDIKECGKFYITVAYKVYEIYYYETYKERYKNIVECCENEFGFKKSTTYNLLNIVKKFGTVEDGMITYKSVCKYTNYSYTQLVCMLGLSSEHLETITPDTKISEIHKKKKFQPVGKNKNSVVVETHKSIEIENENNIIEVSPEQFEIIENTTSHSKLVQQQLELYNNDFEKTILGLIERINSLEFSVNHFRNLFEHREEVVKQLEKKISQLEAEKKSDLLK